ncbi:MAG TPA: sortase [Chloroflexia bacterium]|nr:sortase [Chloroflexia bacterium]
MCTRLAVYCSCPQQKNSCAAQAHYYIVQDTQLVLEDGATDEQKRQNARFMDPTPDQTLTLITCYPYGIDDHRFIVIAKPYDSGLPARTRSSRRGRRPAHTRAPGAAGGPLRCA